MKPCFLKKKKHKKIALKPKINMKIKKFPNLISFFRCFQGKKTLNLNSSHYLRPFDIKINCFSGHNHC
jgi:hypothetical protein